MPSSKVEKKQNKRFHKVAVIGAGPAGLTAVKCMREAGLESVVFEKSADIGGLWHYDEDSPHGGGIAYRSLKTNTSKKMTAFSDFPFPEDTADFPHRTVVLDYFNSYADHFGLRPYIHLNTAVEKVTRQEDGRWIVAYKTEGNIPESQLFDAVVVASGFYQQKVIPSLPGLDNFAGEIVHSADYKGPELFAGKRVVVIGAGSSGSDIAGEVGKTAEQVDISAKSGVWFVPHKANGRPLDNNLTRFSNLLPASVRKRFFENVVLDCYRTIGFEEESMTAALALPEYDPKLTRVTPGTLILQQIRDGKVHVKGDIQRIEPDGVCYKDGSKTTAGVLIFCTGYAPSLPFMDPSIIEVKEDNTFGLYKHIFHPEIDNLAFLAQCRVGGPVFPVMEMQARWAARVFTGTADLPSPAARKDSINEHFAACRKHDKNPMQVSYGPYMDDIARQFGVRPKLFAHPGLFRKLMFGPILPAQFRLDGPGNSAKSREIIEQH